MPTMLVIVVMAIIATVVLAVGQGVYWASVARREQEEREMVRRLGMMSPEAADSLFRERARDAAVATLGNFGGHLQDIIEQADSKTSVTTLLSQMGVAAAVAAVVGFFMVGALGALLFAPIGFVLPYALMRRAGSVRSSRLVEQLPEALDLMARSLQAGLGLNEAFRTCAEEMPLPVASEFARIFEEVRFGRDYRDAFQNMLKRNPNAFDLRLFVSSVLLQRETGGNLIEILEAISSTIRGRFLFQAKVRAMTSEARFSALILGGLPFGVGCIVAFMNPTYLMPLLDDPIGHVFLGMFVALYVFGGFLMYKVSQVEV